MTYDERRLVQALIETNEVLLRAILGLPPGGEMSTSLAIRVAVNQKLIDQFLGQT